jgi:RNA polymerase sigma-70 factor (ECF subfamily)
VSEPAAQGVALLDLYDEALPQVYGYLIRRCGDEGVAEDLTSETFMAAVDGLQQGRIPDLSVAWLVGVARHKLVDHWRAREREERKMALVVSQPDEPVDEWDVHLDAVVAQDVLAGLGPHHRAALTLRYLDGLPVPEVAGHLGRTLHATEALLVRARAAFRQNYDKAAYDDA